MQSFAVLLTTQMQNNTKENTLKTQKETAKQTNWHWVRNMCKQIHKIP